MQMGTAVQYVYVDTNWLHVIEVTTDLAECLHTVHCISAALVA